MTMDEVERVAGIEPAYSAWKAAALPLSYTRAGAEPNRCRALPQPPQNGLFSTTDIATLTNRPEVDKQCCRGLVEGASATSAQKPGLSGPDLFATYNRTPDISGWLSEGRHELGRLLLYH